MEWVKPASQSSRVLVYRNHPLETRNENITRSLVFVHGINRDADSHFRTALAAAFLAGALDDTVIVAPRFASKSGITGNEAGMCGDTLASDEANWVCETSRTDTWRSGGGAVGNADVSSFDFMDEIVRLLSNKQVFPNLKSIVIASHSAGGQFVQRYAMTNQVDGSAGVPIHYAVSNSSSYAYVDDLRPTASSLPTNVAASSPGFTPPPPKIPPPAFVPYPDAKNCTTFNDWPHGVKNRAGYAARVSEAQIKKQLATRSVSYLLGEADILPLGIFDASYPAVAQGQHASDAA